MSTKTAIYLRVSTDDQATDGYGLDAQRTKCQAMAAVKGWTVATEYIDSGISGTKDATGRPALAAMLQAAGNGEIGAVIVAGLDRLGRTSKIILDLVDTLSKKCGVELVSCKESIDTSTITGRFVLTIFAGLAEMDREFIVQRTTDGRNERGKIDGEKGGPVPMGYRRTETGLHIIPEQAATVRYIFALREEGQTLTQIADRLNFNGTTTRRGHGWHASSVREVLLNEDNYRGGLRGESPERWPVILN